MTLQCLLRLPFLCLLYAFLYYSTSSRVRIDDTKHVRVYLKGIFGRALLKMSANCCVAGICFASVPLASFSQTK